MISLPKKEPLNLVPFIDIMLVLLAMVLSISTFIARGEIAVALPQSEASHPAADAGRSHTINVDGSGTVYLDDQQTETAALAAFVENVPRNERIVLRIDKSARFEHFIGVVDLLKKYRHENFTIATERIHGR